jgi:hypothetical protein
MMYTVEMASDGLIYVPSYIKICSGTQVIDNLRVCSVCINNGNDL